MSVLETIVTVATANLILPRLYLLVTDDLFPINVLLIIFFLNIITSSLAMRKTLKSYKQTFQFVSNGSSLILRTL